MSQRKNPLHNEIADSKLLSQLYYKFYLNKFHLNVLTLTAPSKNLSTNVFFISYN